MDLLSEVRTAMSKHGLGNGAIWYYASREGLTNVALKYHGIKRRRFESNRHLLARITLDELSQKAAKLNEIESNRFKTQRKGIEVK